MMLAFPDTFLLDIVPKLDMRVAVIDALAREWRQLYPVTDAMKLAQESYDEDFLVRMAYNSNAIEGSTLTLAETEVIYEGEFIPGKPGRDQVAARGLIEGVLFLDRAIREGASLGEALLRDLHESCALDLQPAARGMYRVAPALIRASRTTPVEPSEIRNEMGNLFYRSEALFGQAHPLLVMAWFHAAFEAIHPFADGNGRTGRLWMNGQLKRHGYPPVCIKVDHAVEYKVALESWQVEGKWEPFVQLVASCLEEELERRIAFLSQAFEQRPPELDLIKRGGEALGIIDGQPHVTARELGGILGVSARQAQRILRQLRDAGIITRKGAPKNGCWEIVERLGRA